MSAHTTTLDLSQTDTVLGACNPAPPAKGASARLRAALDRFPCATALGILHPLTGPDQERARTEGAAPLTATAMVPGGREG